MIFSRNTHHASPNTKQACPERSRRIGFVLHNFRHRHKGTELKDKSRHLVFFFVIFMCFDTTFFFWPCTFDFLITYGINFDFYSKFLSFTFIILTWLWFTLPDCRWTTNYPLVWCILYHKSAKKSSVDKRMFRKKFLTHHRHLWNRSS